MFHVLCISAAKSVSRAHDCVHDDQQLVHTRHDDDLRLKFLPKKASFPSHEAEFGVPRSVYGLIRPISSSARFCLGLGVVVIWKVATVFKIKLLLQYFHVSCPVYKCG